MSDGRLQCPPCRPSFRVASKLLCEWWYDVQRKMCRRGRACCLLPVTAAVAVFSACESWLLCLGCASNDLKCVALR